jgi:hypothetical protein
MNNGMNALEALGCMAAEEGKIDAVRHKENGRFLELADLKKNGLSLSADELNATGYELGWSCPVCCGSGMVANPLKYWPHDDDEVTCSQCDSGIRWEKEY